MRNPKAKKAAKTRAEKQPAKIDPATEKRSKAYRDMEPHVGDLSRAAELAMEVFDRPELFLFAVSQLDDMVQQFKANYYAQEFPI
jgi:hypothetical protein